MRKKIQKNAHLFAKLLLKDIWNNLGKYVRQH